MEEIKLSLDPAAEAAVQAAVADAPADVAAAYMQDVNLTEEEKKQVEEFAQKIDLKDANITMHYG
ncbi:MAG: toxic anion resistance protein, partial [Firmicutes bacterium]|nr:toxic anion resistance protein [Bacillota bacterium]